MTCVIIDDEPKAIEILQRYVGKVAGLELLSAFDSPLEALDFLKGHPADCLLLDINMPDIDGLQLSRLLANVPVVFMTAYPQFALESYEVSAVDYLLKPVTFPRFLQAVEKLRVAKKARDMGIKTIGHDDAIFVKSSTKTFRVLIDEVNYLETMGNNIIFHTHNTKITSRLTVKALYDLLPMDNFVRIHKSFIVAKDKILVIENHQVTTRSGASLPIGAAYRAGFKDFVFLNK